MECATHGAMAQEGESWRRRCGCLRTSDKLKRMLDCFPPPPPPTPEYSKGINSVKQDLYLADLRRANGHPRCRNIEVKLLPESNERLECVTKILGNTCISAFCTSPHFPTNFQTSEPKKPVKLALETQEDLETEKALKKARTWHVMSELVHLIQISVTATALALYYLIYCYMQLVYYTLRSALYVHNADGPMKVTIAVVTVTSLVVAFNVLLKIEKIIGVS
ncbi:uncharacterized protein LOC128198870 [Bicyclus anynana]|uniref:Uncharacterized protein LOC128198870 n=1 Tax=Bicyclus anynana TaxID=110368 RepID=A0ABM3LT78_BICAN|nr:uncharacterized protein LOC128198870 [Bicyclus anynana]